MKRIIHATLLTIILVMLYAVQSAMAASYTNLNHGFSINFPSGWEEMGNPDVLVLYQDTFGTGSINVIVEETQLSLEDYVSQAKASLEYLDYYDSVSERSRTIGTLNGYELVFTWTLIDNDDYYDLKDKQLLFVENGKGYIISCGSDISDYDSYLSTFEQSLQTFSLMSPEDLGQLNTTLIIAVVAIIAVVIVILVLFFLRRKKPAQTQYPTPASGTTYPPPPPPPPEQ